MKRFLKYNYVTSSLILQQDKPFIGTTNLCFVPKSQSLAATLGIGCRLLIAIPHYLVSHLESLNYLFYFNRCHTFLCSPKCLLKINVHIVLFF